jgi:hypothetical protein
VVSQIPRTSPCRAIASRAYCEHVGLKRHIGKNAGETQRWYPRMSALAARFIFSTSHHLSWWGARRVRVSPPWNMIPCRARRISCRDSAPTSSRAETTASIAGLLLRSAWNTSRAILRTRLRVTALPAFRPSAVISLPFSSTLGATQTTQGPLDSRTPMLRIFSAGDPVVFLSGSSRSDG